MRSALLLGTLLAGCASAPPGDPAPMTIYGKDLRLERWSAVVVERGHLHADLTDYPCPMPDLLRFTDSLDKLVPGTQKQAAEKLGTAIGGTMDLMCTREYGRAYGGPEQLVLALLRTGEDPKKPLEAIVLDFPRLKPDEKERLFKTGEFSAAWERPPKTVEATIRRGWTRVIRRPSGYEFEIFLVLAGAGDPTQIVARVEVDAR